MHRLLQTKKFKEIAKTGLAIYLNVPLMVAVIRG